MYTDDTRNFSLTPLCLLGCCSLEGYLWGGGRRCRCGEWEAFVVAVVDVHARPLWFTYAFGGPSPTLATTLDM